MDTVASIVFGEGRRWVGKPPATETEVKLLRHATEFELPPRYLELLRTCNGGEGELALAPLWFQLFDAAFATQMAADDFYRNEFKGLFFFGSNGGLESIALDVRGRPPWPVVMVDCIAGITSAEVISRDIEAFVEAIGFCLPGDEAEPGD